ncbi:Ubiquitin carboxyl-terminal hydrolase 14, partial [Pelomyxa schiedti]
MTTRNVVVKWGKTKLDLSVDLSDTYETFKAQLFALSGVPMERQKIMGFKGTPKDGTTLQSLGVKEGQVFMMIGSADSVQAPSAKTVFVEDMAPSEVAAQAVLLPPGLRNVGNTCYMNSTVQMLGSIPELREIIIRNPAKDADLRAQMVKSLGTLFGMLAHSHQPVVPLQFYADMIRAYPQFGEVDEKSNVPRQQDAEECWTSIFMSIIQKVAAEQRLKFLFEGELEATYTCKEAVDETPSVVKDPFYKLSCNIDNSISHMIDGLKLNMSGEVEKRSPSLNREAIYTKKQLISRLPKYITVQFVRFFWKKTAQGKTKITK